MITFAGSLREKMPTHSSSFSLVPLPSPSHSWARHITDHSISPSCHFKSLTFCMHDGWKMVEATDFLLLVVFLDYRLLLWLPGPCSLASQGICWPSTALAHFRSYVLHVNKYSWVAFELSSLEHRTASFWNFPYSTSNSQPHILGSSETVMTPRELESCALCRAM